MILGPTIFFSKEAIYLLYFDIFQVKKSMRVQIIGGMIFTGLVYWTGVITTPILCAPYVGETWDPLAGAPITRRCHKNIYWGIVQGACAVLIDIHIFMLPIPPIIRLQLARKRKYQVLAVFMTALLCVPLSIFALLFSFGALLLNTYESRGILASVFAEVYRVQLLTTSDGVQWGSSKTLICV